MKPEGQAEISELISAAAFHPQQCHLLMHGSTKGFLRLGDMRERALLDRHASVLLKPFRKSPQFLTEDDAYFCEITNSVLDFKFSPDGNQVLARDYMTLRLWDLKMPNKPVR